MVVPYIRAELYPRKEGGVYVNLEEEITLPLSPNPMKLIPISIDGLKEICPEMKNYRAGDKLPRSIRVDRDALITTIEEYGAAEIISPNDEDNDD